MNPSLPERTAGFLREISSRPADEQTLLTEAMFAAAEFHSTQRRIGGELFVIHCIEVATSLAASGSDTDTVVAGLLHDVLEDTGTPPFEIGDRFGGGVLDLVEAVSLNLSPDLDVLYGRAEKDPRIADIKLADRAANLGSILVLRKERHLANLQEAESYHLARLATIPGVRPQLVQLLKDSVDQSWKEYRSRTD